MSVRVHVGSALVGALSLIVAILATSAVAPQAVAHALRIAITEPVQVVGMPPASHLVDIASYDLASQTAGVPFPAGQSVTLYNVPSDKRFVLQSIVFQGPPVGNLLLLENLGGVLTAKSNPNFMTSLAQEKHHIVFQPGAEVQFLNVSALGFQLEFLLTGYVEDL